MNEAIYMGSAGAGVNMDLMQQSIEQKSMEIVENAQHEGRWYTAVIAE